MVRILLVDDVEGVRDSLGRHLEKAGFEVAVAADGVEAEKMCEELDFDLVITDIFMPNKDGNRLIWDLKRRNPELRVIAFSGGYVSPPEQTLDLAEKLGADLTLKKPVRAEKLVETVRSVLQGKALGVRNGSET